MGAQDVLTAPALSMAIAFETPSAGGVGSAPMMSAKSAQATKKQDHLIAGRRRLEEFKQKKKREKATNPTPDSLDSDHGSKNSSQNNGEFGASNQVPGSPKLGDSSDLDKPPNLHTAGSVQSVSIPAPHILSKPFANTSREANDSTFNSLPSIPFSSVANGNSLPRPFEAAHPPPFEAAHPPPFEAAHPPPFEAAHPPPFEAAPTPPVTAKYDQDIQDLKPAVSFQKDSLDGIALNQRPLSSSSKDEFAALEQHIEDLTQDKFSLQRGLEATRALVESLSQENSALTEDYNQQGATINELKVELERYQEGFRANEILLKNLKAEKDRAQQESKSATERSRALAAEVIDLEERVLKTRSQELKLQKEVESMVSEIGSCRKQISSLEKDRSNFKTMIEALQEEKKVLLARLREAANKVDVANKSRADASTSTDDLVLEDLALPAQEARSVDDSSSMLHPGQDSETIPSTSTSTSSLIYPASIPADQLSMIESINTLVAEVGQEKEALLRALRKESTAIDELKAENAELLRKFERQTQQLELAVAQNMARESFTSLSFPVQAEPEFVDEGDEVVDRVLQWIMRLFPGGSAKHGGSKRL